VFRGSKRQPEANVADRTPNPVRKDTHAYRTKRRTATRDATLARALRCAYRDGDAGGSVGGEAARLPGRLRDLVDALRDIPGRGLPDA
jgi:hypothetical protein